MTRAEQKSKDVILMMSYLVDFPSEEMQLACQQLVTQALTEYCKTLSELHDKKGEEDGRVTS